MGLTGAAQGRGGAAPLLCTVAHPRETGLVQALWSSLRSRHELGRMYVLWLEPPPRWLRRGDEPIELEPADVGLERPRHAAFAHDAAALRALLRPRLVEFLLDSGRAPSHVVCVDPGAALRAPLDPLVSLAARSSAVLVPRRSREDRDAAGRGLLEAGAFDDGLVAVGSGEGARELVAWWGRRAAEDPGGRWLDLAPALFPAVVVAREPGLGPAEPAGSGGWRLLRSAHERYPDGVPVASGERAFLRASDPEGIRFP
ncbi:MAG: hypothetical protein QOK40_3313, partial [Miltoncostaeaceae bacterium]|nr:hypothetical protein [Miltoncostaeaceae bacterium]